MTTSRIGIRAYAKINLSLRVTGMRPDGYHQLKTVFQSLALHDSLTFEVVDGPFSISCAAAGVPLGEENLVWRAAQLLWSASGRAGRPAGVRARLVKRIPPKAGLGGGSSDGAAALVALSALWRTGTGPEVLRELAGRLGADVPFFLCGGTALGLDRGDEVFPLEDLARRHVVLVLPPFGVSTPEAFLGCDDDACESDRGTAEDHGAAGGGLARLGGGIDLQVVNELQGPVGKRHPEIDRVCRRLAAVGAEAAAMAGSGSTVFGLFARPELAIAAAAGLEASGHRTLVTRTAARRQARAAVRLVWTRSSRIN